MIKLQTQKSKTSGTRLLLNNILIINKVKYDFDNLDTDSSNPVYKDAEGNIQILLSVPENRFFMFHSGNLLRFFDIDSNGIIDLSELKTAIDYINETDEEKLRENLKVIRDKYLETHTTMEWRQKGIIKTV
jgi:hypothetical protein